MKIQIKLSENGKITQNSLKNATDKIKKIKLALKGEMIKEFYSRCAETLIEMICANIDIIDIGAELKAKLKASWKYEVTQTESGGIQVKIFTKDTRATFIEFGTGIVGKNDPHPLADKDNYAYDVDSEFKLDDRSWFFGVKKYEMRDIPENSIIETDVIVDELLIKTQGAKATMFAYNAFMNFVDNDMPKTIWGEVVEKYLGGNK